MIQKNSPLHTEHTCNFTIQERNAHYCHENATHSNTIEPEKFGITYRTHLYFSSNYITPSVRNGTRLLYNVAIENEH